MDLGKLIRKEIRQGDQKEMKAKNVVVVVDGCSGFLQQWWVTALISRCMSARYLFCYANSLVLAVIETVSLSMFQYRSVEAPAAANEAGCLPRRLACRRL